MKTRSTFSLSRLRKSLFYRSTLVTTIAVVLSLPGCKKEEATPDPNAIREGVVRITATITAPGIEPTDVFRAVGNFYRPNYYNIDGMFVMKRQPDGTYRIDISKQEIVDTPETLHLGISRNGKFLEADENCRWLERQIPMTTSTNLGKELKITVVNFLGMGSCPP